MRFKRLTRSEWAALAVVAAAVAGPLLYWQSGGPAMVADQPPPAVLVTAATAEIRNVPVYVRGLGSVQAFNTVMVRTRVDGQITKVLFTEGQEVQAGDPLFQIDPRPFQAALDQAEAAKVRDEAQLKGAELDLARYAKLLPSGWQTRQSYDLQEAAVGQFRASVKADQAQIDNARLNLEFATIRSPIGGRTGARLVDIGNVVQASQNTTLVVITQTKPVFVNFAVAQDFLDRIRRASAAAPLAVLAYSNDDKTELARGTLTLINNQVDVPTGTAVLKATFANADERLWPGTLVSARLALATRDDAVTVPAEAVTDGSTGAFVYLIKPDGTVEQRDVVVALSEGDLAVIEKGISVGDRVVVDGQSRLTDGARIREAGPGTKQADSRP